MIRMGKSSTPDDNETSSTTGQTSSAGYSYEQEYGSSKAMSESEAMAKDIKDGRLNGFVGHGTVLTGETYFHSMLRVDGQLTGKVASEDGMLIIGSTGQVDADISVASATISGAVNGDITVTEKLELGRTARVVGNIKTPRLLIEDGAILEGSCSMVQPIEQLNQKEEAAEEEPEEEAYSATSETTEETSSYSSSSYSYESSTDDDDDDDEEDDDEENAEAAVT
ncbi:MAG: polymer-forming cytoskeletal protein [Acidobacteriota bacterium]|nr:MAG: polymer-forming cytoskeletal protein [Acidobacteriota bacterium]